MSIQTTSKGYTVADLMQMVVKVENDINGNPRFYFPFYAFGELPTKLRRRVGLTMYRGKKFGPGFIVSSYNLEDHLEWVIAELKRGEA